MTNERRANRIDTMQGHYERNLIKLGIMGDEMSRMMQAAAAAPSDETMMFEGLGMIVAMGTEGDR